LGKKKRQRFRERRSRRKEDIHANKYVEICHRERYFQTVDKKKGGKKNSEKRKHDRKIEKFKKGSKERNKERNKE